MSSNGKWRKAPVKALNGFSNWLIGTVGVNVQGAEVLTVRGRSSGALRSVTVNPLELDGHTYLLSPCGQTQWVKNLRQAETGTLKRERKPESGSCRTARDRQAAGDQRLCRTLAVAG
jgi:hypothetical protein